MINFNKSYSSFTEGQENLSRRRREIAQAFEQFKVNNPYANMDDFQYFIDSNVDLGMGSNYLRGGAPSRDILQKIANQNEQDRIRAEKKKVLADAIERGNFAGQLTGAADKFLLEYDGDTKKASDALKSMFGDSIDYGALGVGDDYFSGRYDTLIQDRLQDPTNVTALTGYLNSLSLDQLNNLDASNLKKIFDLPETTSDTYLQSAIKQAEEVKRTKQFAQNKEIMELVEAAAAKGDADVKAVIKNYFGGSAISDDEFEKLTKGMDFTQYQARADQLIQERNDADTQKMNIDLSNAINTLRKDEQFTGAMRAGNREVAKEILIRNLNNLMLPRHIIKKFGLADGAALAADNPALNQVFDELYDSMAQYQQGQIQANYAQQKAAIPALGPQLIEKNVAETERILGLALDANVAKGVASSLGSRFLVNQDALIAAIDAMNVAVEENANLPIGDRIAIMQQTLQDRGAIPMQTYISEQGAALIKDTPQRPLTMEEYTTQEMSDLETDFKTITDNIAQINTDVTSASTQDELVDLQRKLAAMKVQIKTFVDQNLQAQQNAMMTADGIDPNGMPVGWLLYGEKLDEEKINSITSFITDQQAAIEAAMEEVNSSITAKIDALPTTDTNTDTTSIIQEPDPEQDVRVVEWYKQKAKEGEYIEILDTLENELKMDTGSFLGLPIWKLYSSESDNMYANFVLGFLQSQTGTSTVRQYLIDNPEELMKFMDNPKSYIESSEAGMQYLQNIANR